MGSAKITGRKLDIKSLRKVPMFLYLGDKDDNDSVKFRDSYEKAREEIENSLKKNNRV